MNLHAGSPLHPPLGATTSVLLALLVAALAPRPAAAWTSLRGHGAEATWPSFLQAPPPKGAGGAKSDTQAGQAYIEHGCFDVGATVVLRDKEDPSTLSPSSCFAACKTVPKARFFGLQGGSRCWCAASLNAKPLNPLLCNLPCAGSKSKTCGGNKAASSIYLMYNCNKKTAEDKKKENELEEQDIVDSYTYVTGQTCGQDPKSTTVVKGANTMIASIDACKVSCWHALDCHGFTYLEDSSTCQFHSDVFAGETKKRPRTACLFRMENLSSAR